ncbi:MAG: hypothetical protein CMI08_04100 [Oceanospirillaceae bacterium]|uniref:efflux RND transporter periplasmic adaptor subunit n=3 Tax=unclassified Thalassolituus TaxID=2624967 RepID=UPI000C37E63E|nr:efflux RND transporter periplasmic adaptor subunit [Thalassolituus sp. UBA6592]MAX98377.1 hypothetical protein [Oceanospirillaceae bacterium]MBS54418.1 hypothetical protein [Oceanospirillaceae bacterium]
MSSANALYRQTWLWVIVILLAGGGLAYWIMTSAPRPARVAPQEQARLVDVVPLQQETSRPYWTTGGTATAVDSVSLVFQVSGRIDWVNPDAAPGALLEQGTVLARLEQDDFQLQVKQAKANLTQAKADLAVEKGQGDLAEEEYAIAAQNLSREERDLVLRKPQLAAAEAAVATAEAQLLQAQLELKRSEIRMPFSGRISSRSASVGSYASSGTAIFDVVGTERVWIEVKVPRHFLSWLDTGSVANVSLPAWDGQQREARILNVLPDVDDLDRQARVVIELTDPMAAPRVLVNDYVDVVLPGKEIQGYVIASRLLQDGVVWAVNDHRLRRREPQVIYRGREKTWLGTSGFKAGDSVLKNRIDTATDGMKVRLPGEAADNGARP